MTEFTEKELRSRAAGRKLQPVYRDQRKNAAVFLPLLFEKGEAQLLFEVRGNGIRQNGEVCFPGGRIDPGEKPEDTALREIREELLLGDGQAELLAPLHVMNGPGGVEVTSYLGILHQYRGTYNRDEVDHVFTLPLSWFRENPPKITDIRMEARLPGDFPYEMIPGGKEYRWESIPRKIYFYETEQGIIWGMTAEFLYHALQFLVPQEGEDR